MANKHLTSYYCCTYARMFRCSCNQQLIAGVCLHAGAEMGSWWRMGWAGVTEVKKTSNAWSWFFSRYQWHCAASSSDRCPVFWWTTQSFKRHRTLTTTTRTTIIMHYNNNCTAHFREYINKVLAVLVISKSSFLILMLNKVIVVYSWFTEKSRLTSTRRHQGRIKIMWCPKHFTV